MALRCRRVGAVHSIILGGLRDVRYSQKSGHGSAHAISQLLSVVFLCDGRSAISDGVGVFRIELEHLVEVLNSPIVLTLVYVGATAIVEGIAVVRIKLDRQVEVLNGAVNLADLVVGTAAIADGSDVVRIEFDCLVVVLDGAVQ